MYPTSNQSSKAVVDFDPKLGRFVISAPPWMVGLCRTMPSRRWHRITSTWRGPVTRLNAQYIDSTLRQHMIITPTCEKVVADALQGARSLDTGAGLFPERYPFRDPQPYKHQKDAMNKLYPLKAWGLLADMGTGKSRVVIDMMSAHRMHDRIDSVVVVCPISIRRNWLNELKEWSTTPYEACLLDVGNKKKTLKWIDECKATFRWLIVGVESLSQGGAWELVRDFLMISGGNSAFIVDESSEIKNHTARRTKRCIELGHEYSRFRGIMTGTPISKGPLDFFSQFEFLDPNIIGAGDFYSFRARYAVMGGYKRREIVGYQNLDELVRLTEPVIYQIRDREALPDLPEQIYQTRYVQLSPQQRELYGKIKKESMAKINGQRMVVKNVLEQALRLRQICGGYIGWIEEEASPDPKKRPKRIHRNKPIVEPDKNPKVQEVLNIAEETDAQIVIWCMYKPEIDAVASALRGRYGDDQVVEVHGGISEEERDVNINTIFKNGEARFVVANEATAGMGLNMTAATVAIYFSNTDVMKNRMQSEKRIHRSGQKRKVLYIDLIADKTIDEAIKRSQMEKKDLSEYIRSHFSKPEEALESLAGGD